MANSALELVATVLTMLGLMMASASTGMPMWRVTAFIQENIITMETRWEGLWMNCYQQANIRMQCKVYDSLLYLPPELQASRGLMCCAVALSGVGLLISLVGLQCTSCIHNNNPRAKRMVLLVAGIMVLLACLCVLVPVSWTAHVIITDFYNPLLIDAQRRELGEALYIGWVGALLLFVGGCIFTCCNVSGEEDKYPDRYEYYRNSQYSYPPPQVLHTQPPQQQDYPRLQPRPQPMLSRHPSSVYTYQTTTATTPHHSRHPSARSAMAYL